jgi:hypothetical protein
VGSSADRSAEQAGAAVQPDKTPAMDAKKRKLQLKKISDRSVIIQIIIQK